jgi:hypothetical protein
VLGSPWLIVVGIMSTGVYVSWRSLTDCLETSRPAPLWRQVNIYGVCQVLGWDLVFAYTGALVVFGGQKAASLNLSTTFAEASPFSKFLLTIGVGLAAGGTGATSRHLGRRVGHKAVEAVAAYPELGTAQVIPHDNVPHARVIAYDNVPYTGFKAISGNRDDWVNERVETTARKITADGAPTSGQTLVKECETAALMWLASRFSGPRISGVTGRSLGIEGPMPLTQVQQSLEKVTNGPGPDLLKIETCLLVMIENRGLQSVDRLHRRLCNLPEPQVSPPNGSSRQRPRRRLRIAVGATVILGVIVGVLLTR